MCWGKITTDSDDKPVSAMRVYFRIRSHAMLDFSIPTPTPHPTFTSTTTMNQASVPTPSRLSPKDIRRRVNDLDAQVRQGLEEGTIRQVMKKLGPLFVSSIAVFLVLLSPPLVRILCWPIRKVHERKGQHFPAAFSSMRSFGPGTRPNCDTTRTSWNAN